MQANVLFGSVNLTKTTDIDKHKYFGYGIGFDGHRFFPRLNRGTERNVIIFGVDMSSFTKNGTKKRHYNSWDIPTQGLGEHSLFAEKMHSINFTKVNTKFCASLRYNGANNYLFVNITEIHKSKAKDSEIVPNNLGLENVSKDFLASNMKKNGFNGHIYDLIMLIMVHLMLMIC